MTKRLLTDAQEAEIRRLRASDQRFWSIGRLSERFACSERTIGTALRGRSARLENPLVQAGLSHTRPHPRISQADLRRLQRAIPVDTRDLTGRFFGDPIPGRSALDRKLGGLP